VPPLATALFDYDLPPHLVAQFPAARRDAARLLVVHRATRTLEHRTFSDLGDYLRAGDVLFRNNAAVLPARLLARRPTGGSVECLLLRPLDNDLSWRCLVRPGRKLLPGATFADPNGAFSAEIVGREPDGSARVRFATASGESIAAIANRIGDVPLPPYIERPPAPAPERAAQRAADLERYQTVYADPKKQFAVAAPTAGLHFTPELLARLPALSVATAEITLHVGLGTFQPIATTHIEDHAIHCEVYEIPAATQQLVFSKKIGRHIAVGTTTVRALEDFLAHHQQPLPDGVAGAREAAIYIRPPWSFRGVDALITNFHQPRSTLLCLVAAFLAPQTTEGIAWIREIYREAIAREYRFFSYGDAMLIV